MKAYLASGWFTDEQEKGRKICKAAIEAAGWGIHSPKDDNEFCPTLFTPAQVFEINLKGILDCDAAVTNLDGLDPGTIFEMGYAHRANRLIIAYSTVKSKTNLMLAIAAYAFFSTGPEIAEYLKKWAAIKVIPHPVPYKGDYE